MATKRTVDHNARFRSLLKEMQQSLARNEKQEKDLQGAALRLVESLKGSKGFVEASRRMETAQKNLEATQRQRLAAVAKIVKESMAALQAMQLNAAVSGAGTGDLSSVALNAVDYVGRKNRAESSALKAIGDTIARYTDQAISIQREVLLELGRIKDNMMEALAVQAGISAAGSSGESILQRLRQTRPVPGAEIVGHIQAGTNSILRALSGQRVTSTGSFLKTPAVLKAIQGYASTVASAAANKVRSAGNTIMSTYQDITDRALRIRELRALEALNKGTRRNSEGSFPWMSLLGAAAAALGAYLADLWKKISGFFSEFHPGLLLDKVMKGFMAVKEWLGTKWTSMVEAFGDMKKWVGEKWVGIVERMGQFKEWAAAKLEPIAKVLDGVAEATKSKIAGAWETVKGIGSGVAAKVESAASTAMEYGSKGVSIVKNAGSTIAEYGGKAWNYARSAGSTVAEYGGKAWGVAKSMGGQALTQLQNIGNKGLEWGSRATSMMGNVLDKVRGSWLGQIVGKWANKLGNIGVALSTIVGIYEEANGIPPPEQNILEAILDPMTFGRNVGHKFNTLFEKYMGTSVGSWLYDLLNDDPAFNGIQQELQAQGVRRDASGRLIPPNTTPVRASGAPATQPTSIVKVPQSLMPNTRAKSISSVTPSLSPDAIPDYAGVDPYMAGINLQVFGGAR